MSKSKNLQAELLALLEDDSTLVFPAPYHPLPASRKLSVSEVVDFCEEMLKLDFSRGNDFCQGSPKSFEPFVLKD